jgi:hypothetical protein
MTQPVRTRRAVAYELNGHRDGELTDAVVRLEAGAPLLRGR